MADIFLSYSREDHARAEQIAAALTAAGYEVFWDVEIPPGKSWADILEEKLSACKAAIVLWSQVSTASKWVREEARLAHDRGKLIPVLIDGSPPPFGFGEIQAADLRHWRGDTSDAHWRLLLTAVAAAVARPPSEHAFKSGPAPAPYRLPSKGLMSSAALGYVLAAVGVVALIAAIAFHFMVPNSTPPGTVEVPAVSPAVPGAPPRPIGPPPAVPDKGLAPAPPTAPAPPPTEASSGGITRKEMADFLISRGYQASVTGDGIGNTIVKTAADGTTFDVYFFGCSGERCAEIQFSAGWKMVATPSAETLNAWNRDKRLVRAYLSEDGNGLFAEMDLDLAHEISTAQIESYLNLWKLLLADFKKRFAL